MWSVARVITEVTCPVIVQTRGEDIMPRVMEVGKLSTPEKLKNLIGIVGVATVEKRVIVWNIVTDTGSQSTRQPLFV